ncbi:hypothetical protein [Streptomyces subrutilus]|uniref:hypothetical protein n=1 Tax=Streptomyces subrutilus TaxID=36818 RepID=UPI002E151AE8|nr:hypothetical protein OG479_29465 [Streptomyces subrutilus]
MPNFTNLVAGTTTAINQLVARYRCSHCNSETEPWTDHHGHLHLNIRHDAGCPVLDGALSSIPDTLRAARSTT